MMANGDWDYNIERTGWWTNETTKLVFQPVGPEYVDNMSVATPISFGDLETVTINIAPKQA